MKLTNQISILALSAFLLFSCKKEQFINKPGFLVPLTADLDANLPSIKANGAVLHSEAFGHPDSTMLICIHGGPGSDYRSLLSIRNLANYGYRVVFYDQRGSGLSQRFSRDFYSGLGLKALDMSYDDLSAVIAHYRTKQTQRVVLVGNSWGGILATAYTGRYPDLIDGLIVCEPGGLKWDDVREYVRKSLNYKLSSEVLNDVSYLDQFITGKTDEHAILDYKMAMKAGDNPITGEINTAPASYWRYGSVISDAYFELGNTYNPDFSEGISNFDKPVLFFYSDGNKAYPETWANKISSAYKTVIKIRIKGTGHSGILSDKGIWNEVTLPGMLNYLNSL